MPDDLLAADMSKLLGTIYLVRNGIGHFYNDLDADVADTTISE